MLIKDRFGNYVGAGDFIVYNECQIGQVLAPQLKTILPRTPITASHMKSINATVVDVIRVRTERGTEYLLDVTKKFIKIGGLPDSVTNKFK